MPLGYSQNSATARKAAGRSASSKATGSTTRRTGGSVVGSGEDRILDDLRRQALRPVGAPAIGQVGAYDREQQRATDPGFRAASTGQPMATAAVGAGDATGGTGTGADSAAGDPLTGFASRFTPGGAELLQNEPTALLAETLRSMGLNPSGGYAGLLEPLAGDMSQLYSLFNGGQVGSLSDILNYGNQLFQNYLTPGGPQVSYGGGLEQLFNAGATTPLGNFLGGGTQADPQEQVRNFMSLYGPLVSNSVPLIQQGGLMNYLNTVARDYIASVARGDMSSGNFAAYANARQPFRGY